MTTTVTVTAHPLPDHEVVVTITGPGMSPEDYRVHEGETHEFTVYGGREITVGEQPKA
jgi:hypothetical protein